MRDLTAYRYDADGRIVACKNMGPRMVEYVPQAPRLARLFFHAPPIAFGICGHDRDREARMPGGPPVWFRPNASRRTRWTAWGAAKWSERMPPESIGDLKYRYLDGHMLRELLQETPWDRLRREVTCAPPPCVEVLVYLPVGERVTDDVCRDVTRARAARAT